MNTEVIFDSFKFSSQIIKGIKKAGYTNPTPIQQSAMPVVLEGKDIIGLAQTGTGKTAAFVLPILNRLVDGPRGCIRALIIAPTRELVEQIHEAVSMLGVHTGIRSMTIYGGVPASTQLRKLKQGAEIVVACPGRLLDHLQQKNIQLSKLEFLVLDEADQMFDMGFLPSIRQIVRQLPTKRQTLMFSATMPPDIRNLASEVLREPVSIKIGKTAPATTVAHEFCPVSQGQKTGLLLQLLTELDSQSILIFARTKQRAKRLAQQLVGSGYDATCLQGNLSQNQRRAAIEGFRRGKFQILVATDIAARGIDIADVTHVINFDIPDTVDAYIHRIGRTGRAAKTGDAITLITPEDTGMIRSIERTLGAKVPRRKVAGFIAPESTKSLEPTQQRRSRNFRGHRNAKNSRQQKFESSPLR